MIRFSLAFFPVFIFIFNLNAQSDTLKPNWVSYLANTSLSVRDVHSDCAGNVIYVGGTGATGFQCTPGTINSAYLGGNSDAFVVKVDATGQVLWATLLGGPQYDRAYAVEVDDAGFIYVAGRAGNGLKTTECALQKTFAGDNDANPAYGTQDGFVVKMTPDGKQLVWSTYVGDIGRAFIRDIDLDSEGNIWAALSTASKSFPYITANAAQSTATYFRTPALVKLSKDGKSILFGTYLGDGVVEGGAPTLRVDHHDNVYFMAQASTANIPITPGVFQPLPAGDLDFELAKFAADGTLVYCSFLGGSGTEGLETHSLEVDPDGNAIVAAYSASADYPVVGNVVQNALKGTNDGVITKISADGSTILYSTYLGGDQQDGIEGVGVDVQGRIYVTGNTGSANFPVTPATAYQAIKGANGDGYLAVLSPDLSSIRYATFIGGSGADQLRTCHVDEWGRVYAGGLTASTNLPIFNAFQSTLTGASTGIAICLRPNDFIAPGIICTPSNDFSDPCLASETAEIQDQDVVVYPNPAVSFLNINTTPFEHLQVLELTDLQGHVLLHQAGISAGQRLDVSQWPRGLYFLKIVLDKGIVARKVMLR